MSKLLSTSSLLPALVGAALGAGALWWWLERQPTQMAGTRIGQAPGGLSAMRRRSFGSRAPAPTSFPMGLPGSPQGNSGQAGSEQWGGHGPFFHPSIPSSYPPSALSAMAQRRAQSWRRTDGNSGQEAPWMVEGLLGGGPRLYGPGT